MKNILIISDQVFLKSEIPGGVQICTKEYVELFEKNGFNTFIYPIPHTRNILKRLHIKLGIELYTRYNLNLTKEIIKSIEENAIDIVALNQVDLIRLSKPLKQKFKKLKIIVLSHGNESGDFLHSIVRNPNQNRLLKIRDIIRLGFAIYTESYYFVNYIF